MNMIPIVQATPKMSAKADQAENPIKKISPPEHKKKRKNIDRYVKQNQTGLSALEIQKAYRTPRRKKKRGTLDPSYVQAVFAHAAEDDSLYSPESGIPTSPVEVDASDLEENRPQHVCTESIPLGRGATKIVSHHHYDRGEWSKENESQLCRAIIDNIDNGNFGRINWKNVVLAVGTSYCHVQCADRWKLVKELYDNRDGGDEESS